MSKVMDGLYYTRSHEWVRVEGDRVIVGITDHAQDALGDVVFVDLPAEGTDVAKGSTFGVIESVKAVSDLYAPISGQVVASNGALTSEPALANTDCYAAGWCLEIAPSQLDAELPQLLTAAAYRDYVLAQEKH
jgi:glycine cleavage system H protein